MAMIGEIKLWGGYFAPRGWRFCDGSKADDWHASTLYSIIGERYGWSPDNVVLPNLEPVRDKDGEGISQYIIYVEGEYPQHPDY